MLAFPTSAFTLLNQQVFLDGQVIRGGQSAGGAGQVVKTDGGGFWVFVFSDGNLNSRANLKTWRRLNALLDGGATKIVVPLCDRRQAPVPIVDGVPYYGEYNEPHNDGTLFTDLTGYVGAPIVAITVGDTALRATEIAISITDGGQLEGGEYFSIDHDDEGRRLYIVGSVLTDDGAGNYTIKIRPPLRQATEDGANVDFNAPGCVMTVADGPAMAPTVRQHRFATGQVTFVEAFFDGP